MLAVVTDDQNRRGADRRPCPATIGLVSVVASRNELGATRELGALNTVLEKLPAGDAVMRWKTGGHVLLCLTGAPREPLGVFTLADSYLCS